MEQAFYISRSGNLSRFTDDFNRVYFGQEFCERLIPSAGEVDQALSFVGDRGLPFTLVTPYVTQRGLERLEELIPLVAQRQMDAEVVFNDWGVFHLLKEICPGLTPVMGRLLNKLKRGPRIMNILDKVPDKTRAYFCGSGFDTAHVAGFLENQGIGRVEFDNLLQQTDVEAIPASIHKTLYLPFAFVSTTRYCLSAGGADACGVNRVGVLACAQECREYYSRLENPVMGVPLIRSGNTIFYLNENIPNSLGRRLFDRVVVMPEVPV